MSSRSSYSTLPRVASASGPRRLFEALEAACERERGALIAKLRQEIEEGRYRPNLSVVAERLLADFRPLDE